MALGFGLGLGLQGTPKDYVDLVKSREAAKAKAAAAKQAKDQAAVQRLYEKFTYSNKDRSFLPIHQEPADVIIQGVLDTFDEGLSSDSPNYTQIYSKVAQAQSQLNNFVAQKKYIDEINQDPYKRGFTPQAMQVVTTERDPEKFAEQMSRVGVGFSFDKNSRNLGFAALTDFPSNTVDKQLESYFKPLGESAYDPREIKAVNDVKGTRYEYYGLAKQFKDAFMSASLQNPGSRREFEMVYQSNNPDKPLIDVTTPEGLTAFNDYLNNKYDTYTESKLTSKSGRAEYQPPALTKTEEAVFDIVPYQLYEGRNGSVPSAAGIGFQSVKVTSLIPAGMIDQEQLLQIKNPSGTLSFSGFYAVPHISGKPVMVKDIKDNGDIELKIAAGGKLETSSGPPRTAYSFAPATQSSALQSVNRDERNALAKKLDELKKAVKEFNSLDKESKRLVYDELMKGEQNLVEVLKDMSAGSAGTYE